MTFFASPAVPSQKKPFLTEVSGNWNVLVEVWAMGISPGCVRQLGYLEERVQQHQVGHFKAWQGDLFYPSHCSEPGKVVSDGRFRELECVRGSLGYGYLTWAGMLGS